MKQLKGFFLGVLLTLGVTAYAQVDESLLFLARTIDQNVTTILVELRTILVELRTIKGILMP